MSERVKFVYNVDLYPAGSEPILLKNCRMVDEINLPGALRIIDDTGRMVITSLPYLFYGFVPAPPTEGDEGK